MGSPLSAPILVVDTSAAEIAVAIGFSEGSSASLRHRPTGFLSEQLGPAVSRLLGAEGLTPRQLAAVAAIRGPGSFTGLRVGLAWSLGLAESLSVPSFGLGSLESLAAGAAGAGARGRIAAILRSGNRRGDWYGALFDCGGGTPLPEPRLELPPGVVAGSELDRFLSGVDAVVGDLPPEPSRQGRTIWGRGEGLAGALALARTAFTSSPSPSPLVPLYLLEPAPIEKLRGART